MGEDLLLEYPDDSYEILEHRFRYAGIYMNFRDTTVHCECMNCNKGGGILSMSSVFRKGKKMHTSLLSVYLYRKVNHK